MVTECVCGMRLGWEEYWLRTGWGVRVLMLVFVGCLGVVGDPAACEKALGSFLRKLWMAWVSGRGLRV